MSSAGTATGYARCCRSDDISVTISCKYGDANDPLGCTKYGSDYIMTGCSGHTSNNSIRYVKH